MLLERQSASQQHPSQAEPREKDTTLEDVLDKMFSAERIVELYDNHGLNMGMTSLGLTRVRNEILSVLESLNGSDIGRGYVDLTKHNPGWLQFLEKKLKEGKYEITRDDYIAFARECLREGNLASAKNYFSDAVTCATDKQSDQLRHFVSNEELRPIVEPYKQEILAALSVALSNPSDMRLYNVGAVIETFRLLRIEVPSVAYLYNGISNLGYCAKVNPYHLRAQCSEEEKKQLFEPNSQGIYSVWAEFNKSGDKGMIEFVEKNFPTYIADFKRQEQERLEMQKKQTGR
jgi:hypothetical protein